MIARIGFSLCLALIASSAFASDPIFLKCTRAKVDKFGKKQASASFRAEIGTPAEFRGKIPVGVLIRNLRIFDAKGDVKGGFSYVTVQAFHDPAEYANTGPVTESTATGDSVIPEIYLNQKNTVSFPSYITV